MSLPDNTHEQAKALLRAKGLEDEFMKSANIDSLDPLDPIKFNDLQPPAPKEKTASIVVPSAAPVPIPDLKKSHADSSSSGKPTPHVSSDMLEPFLSTKILYASRKRVSSYTPSALMMFNIVHMLNNLLVDNFYFKRYCPEYHPYVLRLYFGILFIIQVLRAGHDAQVLSAAQHEFLTRFLDNFPPESLPIPGPLLALFKTICSSIPEIPAYGKVYPLAPEKPGPQARSSFTSDAVWILNFPQIPAIFALLEDLNSKINAENPIYPKKNKHSPITNTASTFGHHAFPEAASRTDLEKWSLVCSGLEHPCEADAKLNEAFAERYDGFGFPVTAATDDLTTYEGFTSLVGSPAWFSNVRDVAAAAAHYCEGSGTLADCSPHGIVSNQIIVRYCKSSPAVTPPSIVADPASLFPLSFKLSTTARSLPALAEALASMAQTHVYYPRNHPWASTLGTEHTGGFWDIIPVEYSAVDIQSINALPGTVKRMVKSRV